MVDRPPLPRSPIAKIWSPDPTKTPCSNSGALGNLADLAVISSVEFPASTARSDPKPSSLLKQAILDKQPVRTSVNGRLPSRAAGVRSNRPVGEGKMRLRTWSERGSASAASAASDGREEFFISEQMPDCLCSVSINSQDSQQPKSAFQLKQQIITGCEGLTHE